MGTALVCLYIKRPFATWLQYNSKPSSLLSSIRCGVEIEQKSAMVAGSSSSSLVPTNVESWSCMAKPTPRPFVHFVMRPRVCFGSSSCIPSGNCKWDGAGKVLCNNMTRGLSSQISSHAKATIKVRIHVRTRNFRRNDATWGNQLPIYQGRY